MAVSPGRVDVWAHLIDLTGWAHPHMAHRDPSQQLGVWRLALESDGMCRAAPVRRVSVGFESLLGAGMCQPESGRSPGGSRGPPPLRLLYLDSVALGYHDRSCYNHYALARSLLSPAGLGQPRVCLQPAGPPLGERVGDPVPLL